MLCILICEKCSLPCKMHVRSVIFVVTWRFLIVLYSVCILKHFRYCFPFQSEEEVDRVGNCITASEAGLEMNLVQPHDSDGIEIEVLRDAAADDELHYQYDTKVTAGEGVELSASHMTISSQSIPGGFYMSNRVCEYPNKVDSKSELYYEKLSYLKL